MFNFLYTSNLVTIFVFRLFGYCSGRENNSEQDGIRQAEGGENMLDVVFVPAHVYLFISLGVGARRDRCMDAAAPPAPPYSP